MFQYDSVFFHSDQTWLSEFGEAIEVMISPELTEVPTAAEILTQPLLSNPLVLTLKFVEEITLKTETEKQEFFSSLTGRLRELPEIVIAKMLVRPLLRRFVVQEELAYRKVLPCLLTPKSKSEYLKSCSALLCYSCVCLQFTNLLRALFIFIYIIL